MTTRILFLTTTFLLLTSTTLLAQEELIAPVLNYMEKKAAEKIEGYLQESDSMHQDEPEGEDWDDILRTSDMESDFYHYKRPEPEGLRIGCICMDGSRMDDKGRGACAGYGGVRFWLYQNDSAIVQVPTRRHLEHPQELSELERANLSSSNEATKNTLLGEPYLQSGRSGNAPFYNMISVIVICLTVAYIAKLYFHHATTKGGV